ncbi:adenosylcobinamide-GDP ribazoletransferase [Devosia neptuniae]|uniref:Adenosylcobinamide-GDP ribazoletransferase n=1 Tax=Devosia neptuniae TaxID=191302 RepID=A0ABY6CCV3_9HYPH|nr:adenosylcobinamide-GDP ribazoletransferase [Devosia neptuniae]UXN70070.1 adenosylcobinamide-GDP ribazoletransferase [Devosia neptuniae]
MNGDEPVQDPAPSIDAAAREASVPHEPAAGIGLKDDFIMALRFFSRLPTGDSPHQKPDLGRIAMALPLASIAIGIGPVVLLIGGVLVGLPAYFAAALAVGAMVLASGAMAEDALADAADGLFGGHTPERRLEIMKDSRHGTYGVAALCLFLVLRVMAVGSMAETSPLAAGAAWLAASIVGRSAALWVAVALAPARRDGASATAGQLSWRNFAVGMVFAAVLLFLLGGPASSIAGLVLAIVLSVGTAWGWTALCKRLVGGQSGDLIGALAALIEIAAFTGLLVFARG